MTTRRHILKSGVGLAAILATGKAPAYLVKSMLAARHGLGVIAAKGIPTARNYVQDGLIAMWDGIENAGLDVHDASSTIWKDLAGGRDINIGTDTSKAYFTDNAFHRDSSKGDLLVPAFIDNPCTISITMAVDSNITASSNPRFFSHTASTLSIPVRREFDCYSHNSADAPRLYQPIRCGYFGRPSTGLWAINCIYANSKSVKFIDSICGKNVAVDLTAYEPPLPLNIGAWNGISSAMTGDYYRVAVYSRILTDAEIAANYAIDKARFNLA